MSRKRSKTRKTRSAKAVKQKTSARRKSSIVSAKKKTPTKKVSAKKKNPTKKKTASQKTGNPITARKRIQRRPASRRRTKRASAVLFHAPRWLRFLGGFFYRVTFVGFLGFIAAVCGFYYFSRDLPSIAALHSQVRPSQITILDKNGELITHYGNIFGKPVTIAELPPHVVQAFVATEDRNFYHHLGVNPMAILRALIVNVRSGDIRQGGSTITQQFAKNVFLTPEKTVKRKAQEMLLALQLEMTYSKDEILALYLNNVYFGAGAYGLRAATNRYFDKPPAQLTVGEAAMLAGLLKAPSKYSPSSRPDAARDRARIVILAMHDAGYISREKMDAILAGPIALLKMRDNPAPYATDHVMSELSQVYGPVKGDIVIHTTLNLAAHRKAAYLVKTLPETDTRFKDDIQIGLLALEANGAIRLLIGGRDYATSQYNRVTHARRQPGSAFKPFVYLTALEGGRQPDDIILDAPVELGAWKPTNYKERYYGPVEMGEAMARSLNAAAIRVQEEAGRQEVVAVARRLGFAGTLDPGAALALGVNETTPLNLAKTYLPFANDGYTAVPYIITSIDSADGRSVFTRQRPTQTKVINDKPLVAMNHMLRLVVSMGSGQSASIPGYTTAGKTGTTQDNRDAWFVGHAAGLVGVVWLGKDDFSPMTTGWSPVSGSGTPAFLWKDMMLAALENRQDIPLTLWQPNRNEPSLMERLRLMLSGDYGTSDPSQNDRQVGRAAAEAMLVGYEPTSVQASSMEELLLDVMAIDSGKDVMASRVLYPSEDQSSPPGD